MSDDLFRRTRAMFDLPKGVVYLDGNSLGAMPISARERVRRELDESWGTIAPVFCFDNNLTASHPGLPPAHT